MKKVMFENKKNFLYLQKALLDFDLNLKGLKIFTEIASGSYQYTSIACLLAGADIVYGIVKDSSYGKKEDVISDVFKIGKQFNVSDRLVSVFSKDKDYISNCDIITNSGFVRPIDRKTISYMKPTAVIALMFECWEFNDKHLDLDACKEKDIIVVGVNEHHHLLNLFSAFPYKICKLLFDANMSIYNNKILLIASGEVGDLISQFFLKNDIFYDRISFDDNLRSCPKLSKYDTIVVAELYHKDIDIISKNGFISTKKLKESNPLVQIVYSYGSINREDIHSNNLALYPEDDRNVIGDYLSSEIPIRLNVASLKVGEIISRYRLKGKSTKEILESIRENSLVDGLI